MVKKSVFEKWKMSLYALVIDSISKMCSIEHVFFSFFASPLPGECHLRSPQMRPCSVCIQIHVSHKYYQSVLKGED